MDPRRATSGAARALLAAVLLVVAAGGPAGAADRDHDGLRDGFERRYGVTSPYLQDSDWDGVVDSAEDNDGDRLGNLGEQRFGTNPGRRDSDGDGTPDGAEDHDGDGRSNAKEQEQRPVPSRLTPSLATATRDFGGIVGSCQARQGSSALVRCGYGPPGADTRVALVGDSHAMMLADPFQRVATGDAWRLETMLKGGCIPILGTVNQGQWEIDRGRSCSQWRLNVLARLKAYPPDLVVLTASESYKLVDGTGQVIPRDRRPQLWRRGIERLLDELPARTGLLLLGDVPDNRLHPVNCLRHSPWDMSRCTTRREPLSARRVELVLRSVAADRGEHFATLYGKICSYDPCPVVQGRTLMWRDRSHLTGTFARKLTPSVRKIMRAILE